MADLYNSTLSTADAQAEVNKHLPSSIKFSYGTGPDASYTPSASLEKPVLQALRNRTRELANLKYENQSGGNPNERLVSNIETLQEVYKVAIRLHYKLSKAERKSRAGAKREEWKAGRENVNSQAKVAANKQEQDRVKAKTNELKADKVISETATNSDKIGKETSGFKSLTESTKPKTAIPKADKVKKPEPSPSEMTANVPGITVTKTPSNKSNVDTLVASTTSSTKNLNKVISAGNGKGIRKTLEDSKVAKEYNIRSNQVTSAVDTGARLSDLTRDPAVQNNLKTVGLSGEEITAVNQKMDVAVAKATSKEINKLAVVPQKDFALKQFRALGNPIGAPGVSIPTPTGLPNPLTSLVSSVTKNPLSSLASIAGAAAGASNNGVVGAVVGGVLGSVIGKTVDTVANGANNFAPGNPFGSLGMDFGNIMATVAGIAQGTGPFKELGKTLQSLPNGIDPRTKELVPDLVQPTGVTQLAKTVNKGTKTAVDVPTTPVKEVGKTRSTGIDLLSYNDLDNEFWGGYEPVNSKKELELEIKSSPRVIRNLIVAWTASAENEVYTARSWNEQKYNYYVNKPEAFRAKAGEPIGRDGFNRCNYLIRKDGVLERLIPIGTAPTPYLLIALGEQAKNKYKRVYDQSILIQFDAGILGDDPEAKGDWNNLSDKSITAEQWRTFDMIADVMYRHSPGGVFKGSDQLLNEYEPNFTDEAKSIAPRISRSIQIMGPHFDVGTYLEKKREIPDGEDGEVLEVVLDDTSTETVEVEDPYADLDDDYLNSEVINGNTVSYDEVRGRWQVLFADTNTRKQYGTKDAAYFAARENTGE